MLCSCLNRLDKGTNYSIFCVNWFEFAEIFIIKNSFTTSGFFANCSFKGIVGSRLPTVTPCITDMRSRRLPDSRINNMTSRLLSSHLSQIRRADDSPYNRYREFSIKHFTTQLPVSLTDGNRCSITNICANQSQHCKGFNSCAMTCAEPSYEKLNRKMCIIVFAF